jgi:Flp pilus assembly protein protease CpaA
MHTPVTQPALFVMLAMVSIAAASDWKTGLIPNGVVAAGAGLGVLVQLLAVLFCDLPLLSSLASVVLGLLVCTTLPLVLWLMGGMGGGDLKLFAAIGMCVGPSMGLTIQVWSHVIAVLVLPVYFLRTQGAQRAARNLVQLLRGALCPRERRALAPSLALSPFRFAPAILAASVLVTLLRGGAP